MSEKLKNRHGHQAVVVVVFDGALVFLNQNTIERRYKTKKKRKKQTFRH